MAAKLTGTISKGQGDAHINYKVLIPQVALHCPDIAKCDQFGTINIKLDHPIDKNHADCWSPQISWKPVATLGNERLEALGLIRIALQFPIDGQTYTAWIIIPEGHPNSGIFKDTKGLFLHPFKP